MRFDRLFVILLLAGTLGLGGCGDDDTPTEPENDPNVFCNESLCAANADLKQTCVNTFNTCIAENPDVNDDECVASALLICRE